MVTNKWRLSVFILGMCASIFYACKTPDAPTSEVESSPSTDEKSIAAKGSKQIEYDIVINGTAEKVWAALVDFEHYGKWNQWVPRLEGKPELGATVKAYANSGPQLDLKITSFVEPKEICWVDVTWFTNFGAGGWRCRRIEELPNGAGVRFVNHFEYTGVFASALERATLDFLQKGMQQENANLKTYIEKP